MGWYNVCRNSQLGVVIYPIFKYAARIEVINKANYGSPTIRLSKLYRWIIPRYFDFTREESKTSNIGVFDGVEA